MPLSGTALLCIALSPAVGRITPAQVLRGGSTMAMSKDAGKMTYLEMPRSRGEPTQLCAAYGGVKLEVELIGDEEWAKRKGKIAPFMPYITNPDGTIMLETTVIMKHLATVGGKFVIDAKTEELCETANGAPCQWVDPIFNLDDEHNWCGALRPGEPKYDKWVIDMVAVLKDWVAKLGAGPFFAGETPGYGECYVWHILDNLFAIDKPAFTEAIGAEAMAKLTAFYETFAALDGVKEYLARRKKVWGLPGSRAQPA